MPKHTDRSPQREIGALDLASIMTGLIVIGIIGGVIAAAIFAVIPWAQDKAAKEQVKALVSAENAYGGVTSSDSNSVNTYGSLTDLVTTKFMNVEVDELNPTLSRNKNICASVPTQDNYMVAVRSATGNVFFANTATGGQPTQAANSAATCLGAGGAADGNPEQTGRLAMQLNLNAPGCTANHLLASVPTDSVIPTTMSVNGGTPTPISGYVHPLGVTSGIVDVVVEGKISLLNVSPEAVRIAELQSILAQLQASGVDITTTPEWAEYMSYLGTGLTPGISQCITSITEWEDALGLHAPGSLFEGNSVLTYVAEPPATMTSFSSMFSGYLGAAPAGLPDWDTSRVTDMSAMFSGARNFNADLSKWDVSNVTTTVSMFAGSAFNQDISSWDMSNVKSTASMFNNTPFNQPIGNWDMSKVESTQQMFYGATSFNQDISQWDVSKVKTMAYMFNTATAFNQDISDWNVGRVTEMNSMFAMTPVFNSDLSKWNVRNVTLMDSMFSQSTRFNSDISNWNTSNVKNMSKMFDRAKAFNSDVSNWNTSNVTNMTQTFYATDVFNSDVSNWNTSNVTDMKQMFYSASAFTSDLSNWKVNNVTNMSEMFRYATVFNSDLSKWKVSNVTNMTNMFNAARVFNSNLSQWDVCSTASTNPGETTRTARPTSTGFTNATVSVWAANLRPNFTCA